MPWTMTAAPSANTNASRSGTPTNEASLTTEKTVGIHTGMHVTSSTSSTASPKGLRVRKSGTTEPSTGLTRHTTVRIIRAIPMPAATRAIRSVQNPFIRVRFILAGRRLVLNAIIARPQRVLICGSQEAVMSKANSWLLMGVVVAVGLSAWSAVSHAQAQGRAAAGAAASTATGQFTVNGKAVSLTSSVARTVKDSFEPTKTGYTLILSDVKGLHDKYGSLDKVTGGTLHFIELTLGADKSGYGAILHHSAFK